MENVKGQFTALLGSRQASLKMGIPKQMVYAYRKRLREGRITERTMQKWLETAKNIESGELTRGPILKRFIKDKTIKTSSITKSPTPPPIIYRSR